MPSAKSDIKKRVNQKTNKKRIPDSDSDSDYETITEESTSDSLYEEDDEEDEDEEDDDDEDEEDEISLGSHDTEDDTSQPTPEEIRKTISKIFPSKYMSKKVKSDEKKTNKKLNKKTVSDEDSSDEDTENSLDCKRHNTRPKSKKSKAKKTTASAASKKHKNDDETESELSETESSDDEDNFDNNDRKNINIILGFGPGGQEDDEEYMEDEYALRDEEECDSDDEKAFMKETYQHVEIPKELSADIINKKTKKGAAAKSKSKKNSSSKPADESAPEEPSKFDAEYSELIDMKKYLVERLKKNPNSKMWIKSLKECNHSIKKLVKKERGNNTKEYHKMINSQNRKFTSEIDYFKRKMSKQEQQKAIMDLKTVNEHMQIDKPYRLSILESKLPTKYKATVLQKLNILRSMQPGDPEYYKMKNWIDTFMRIPFGIYRSLNVNLTDGTEACQTFMDRSIQVLDDCVYGMNDAKMQVIQMIGQWITNPSAMGTAIAIKGPMGTGKCLGKNTPILMYDGSIKMVQNIVVGDIIMGDDSTPRNVLSLAKGEDEMYNIQYPNGDKYTVNSEHILSLKRSKYHKNETIDVCIKDYLATDDEFTRKSLQGFRTSINFPHKKVPFDPYFVGMYVGFDNSMKYSYTCQHAKSAENHMFNFIKNHYKQQYNQQKQQKPQKLVPDEYKINDYETRYKFLWGFIDASLLNKNAEKHTKIDNLKLSIESSTYDYKIVDDIVFIARSIGLEVNVDSNNVYLKGWNPKPFYSDSENSEEIYKKCEILYDIEVTPVGRAEYYGFEIDGNRRFVLGDFTVTHNTSLVKEGISKILGREFAFIALGGAGDSSFLEGHSYTYEGSSWGKIIQILIDSKCMNPVIYFDELDKLSDSSRGSEITGILTHLTDTSQNTEFHDKYFSEVSFDLSKCLFIFSYNDESKVNPILRDRMYRIQTKGYNAKEKIIIAKNFILPKIREQVNFEEGMITIPDDVIEYIITKPTFTKNEEGVRNLKRCLEIIYTKLNLFRIIDHQNELFSKEINLKVEFPYTVTKKDADLLIKDDEAINNTFLNMYI
jgi:ATP-dependent Lon protease